MRVAVATTGYARTDGEPALTLVVSKQTGANTVTVTGTRAAGFAIEFAGARAGQDLSAITLSYEPQVASASVAVTQQGEVKQTGTTTSGTNVRERQVISFSGATTNTNVRYTLGKAGGGTATAAGLHFCNWRGHRIPCVSRLGGLCRLRGEEVR